MNITTLMDAVRNAVHDDAATQSWCTTNYSRKHKVYVGVDARKPPAEADYPIVHIFPLGKSVGYDLDQQSHVISVTCGVNTTATVTVTGKVNIIEMQGIAHIEAFRKLVESAIVAVIPSNCQIATLEIEYETIEFYPFFLANMEFTITEEYYQGDGVFD